MDIDERIEWFEKQDVKDCPFCGHTIVKDDPDSLYPLIKKQQDGTLRPYAFNLVCAVPSGGCDASMMGDSEDDCLEKWNRRS